MAIDDADSSDSPVDGASDAAVSGRGRTGSSPAVGEYTWKEYLDEHADDGTSTLLYKQVDDGGSPAPSDWVRAGVDPVEHLGFHPTETDDHVGEAGVGASAVYAAIEGAHDFDEVPVRKDVYSWEEYKSEYYYDASGDPPTDGAGEAVPFDPSETLGFDPAMVEGVLSQMNDRASELHDVVDRRTVNVNEELAEDAFFSAESGSTTVVNRYDLEKAVPLEKKTHFEELERYWVNKPYAFVIIFHSTKENEKKYYVVQPYKNPIEADLIEFLTGKLRTAIKYSEGDVVGGGDDSRKEVIHRETLKLLDRYDLYTQESSDGFVDSLATRFDVSHGDEGLVPSLLHRFGWRPTTPKLDQLDGITARPESAVLDADPKDLTEYQVTKLLYFLKRDFIGYERIDGIKHDINVEDISCDGYNSPVFVYHSDYEQIISNVYHGRDELDDFVVKLAQRSGKGISKRRPQVDATLPDGSRAQLTLGREVSDHGTNYTIRQFKDVPFTPIDLINWNTFSLDEMAFLWLCIENHKSLIFAGGTASGKTTSLNAVSLFIPSNAKIVSIEDTREVELPQRNWIASVTRPSFSDDDKGDVDEFDLLEAALRQRPDYIVMGEIRGEEGRTLFQVMSTGHTTYTTFHADSVGEVLKRFTTDPINVSKTMFTALDLVSIQTSTRVQGNKVRRNKSLTEINHYDAENDEINVQDVYQWQAETDEYLKMGDSNTLDEIKFDRGWNETKLRDELFKRKAVLAYLIDNGLNTYTQVAATFQAFINDPETILALMANDGLATSLEDLREMESVLIDIDPEKEEMVPRPEAPGRVRDIASEILDRADDDLFPDYRNEAPGSIASALSDMDVAADVTAGPSASSDPSETPSSGTFDASDAGDEGSTSAAASGTETDDSTAGGLGWDQDESRSDAVTAASGVAEPDPDWQPERVEFDDAFDTDGPVTLGDDSDSTPAAEESVEGVESGEGDDDPRSADAPADVAEPAEAPGESSVVDDSDDASTAEDVSDGDRPPTTSGEATTPSDPEAESDAVTESSTETDTSVSDDAGTTLDEGDVVFDDGPDTDDETDTDTDGIVIDSDADESDLHVVSSTAEEASPDDTDPESTGDGADDADDDEEIDEWGFGSVKSSDDDEEGW